MDCVVAHPRSGTAFLAQLLCSGGEEVAAHEYLAQLSSDAVSVPTSYYQGQADDAAVTRLLDSYDGSAPSAVRIDSNWKLTWILGPFLRRFPDARVLHLVRDPRDTVASTWDLDYYGRLRERPEFAHDQVRNYWLSQMPAIQRPDWSSLGQFERNCAFWTETQRLLHAGLVNHRRLMRVRLEDLTSSATLAREVLAFFDVRAPSPARLEELLSSRVNHRREVKARVAAHRPPLGPFTEWPEALRARFVELCGAEAARLGYQL
jgi:hypothetical protein